MIQLQWTFQRRLSAYHTGWCIACYPQLTATLPADLLRAGSELARVAQQVSGESAHVWDQLLTLAVPVDSTACLAERVATRVGRAGSVWQTHLASVLTDMQQQFDRAYPDYDREMPLRTGPLRQLWDGFGAGLLRQVERLTGQPLMVEQAEVVLVQPILAGMGYAHLATNRIHLEALLTHADPQLPEALRMAWLLSQLDLERPIYSERIHGRRLRFVAGLAMLPPVLHAGQELELCHASSDLVEQAIRVWRIDVGQHPPAAAAAVVSGWWETVLATRPSWPIALTGLDQLLA